MWERIGWTKDNRHTDDDIRPEPWQSEVVGWVERSLYFASYLLGKPEFIAIWLAVKVAGQWQRWGQDTPLKDGCSQGERKVAGRAVYNNFLVGSGLSIAYAVLGAQAVLWFQKPEWGPAVAIQLLLTLGTLFMRCWVARYPRFFIINRPPD